MIKTLATLLVFQTIGESLSYVFALPITGPVIGMLLLFVYLCFRRDMTQEMAVSASKLLQHLSLLFVPVGVGIMVHVQRVADEWLPITVALLISTVISLVVTAAVMRGLQK